MLSIFESFENKWTYYSILGCDSRVNGDCFCEFIHSLAYSKERSRADNFMPVSSVGCFALCRIQSEVNGLEVVFHSRPI